MSKLSRTFLGGLAATALCGAGFLAAAAPAQAVPDPGSPGARHSAAVSKAEQDAVADYWTPARMRAALPAEGRLSSLGRASADGLVAAGTPTVVPQAATPQAKATKAPSGTSQIGDYYTGGGKVVVTTGKVFFSAEGQNWVCSGSAVSSGNKDVVLSAGHCVYESGEWSTNWTFVPGYDDGAAPYGKFTARSLLTTTQWQAGDFDYDVSFAVMNPLGGKHLTDVVGGQAIGFNQARGQHLYSFGYPAARPYDGTDIAWCHGTTGADVWGGSNDYALSCNMTGGSSGGPWFGSYDTTAGTGVLTSVNSFGYTGLRNYMFGPYFGSVVQSLYGTAASL